MGRPARPFILIEIYLSGKAVILQSGKGMPTFRNAALIPISVFGRLLFARCAAQHFRLRSMVMAISEHQIILTKLEQSNPKTDWKLVDYQYDGCSQMAYCIHDVDFRLICRSINKDSSFFHYKAGWSKLSDHRISERIPVDLFYKSTLIENFTLVLVDSAQAVLPIPLSDDDLRVRLSNYRIAQIFDEMGNLDEYMQRAGLSLLNGSLHD